MVDGSLGSPDGGDTYRSTFDWADPNEPSTSIVELIAEIRDVDPLAVEPLHSYIDTEALDALFVGKGTGGSVVVELDGYRIRIDSDGVIVADPVAG